MKLKTTIENIEKEFDDKFVVEHGGVMPKHRDFGKTLERELKSFISQKIQEVLREVREKIKGLGRNFKENYTEEKGNIEYDAGYANALSDVLSLIEEAKKK